MQIFLKNNILNMRYFLSKITMRKLISDHYIDVSYSKCIVHYITACGILKVGYFDVSMGRRWEITIHLHYLLNESTKKRSNRNLSGRDKLSI